MIYLNFYILIIFFCIVNPFSCSDVKLKKEQQSVKQTSFDSSLRKESLGQLTIEVFAENLYVPWSIVFTDSNRVLVTERNGKIRIIENGKLLQQPLKVFTEISSEAEEGLMGLALDPDYTNNKLLYVSYAYERGGDIFVKVVQFRESSEGVLSDVPSGKDDGYSLSDEKIIFDNVPAAHLHAGCRIRFGPDNKLYITTGDAAERELAQDLNKLQGKILRINSDGTIPSDNPFPNSPIWSYGHRNPQGIDWYPGTDILFATEHGPSGFDGPGGGDEVNIIYKGKNYGWPVVSHEGSREGMVSPVLVFTPAEAPASGMFYGNSEVIPEFKNNFFFGCLRGEGILRVVVDDLKAGKNPERVISFEKISEDYGRIRDVAEGPDGAIYFSTSNRDGRGKPRKGDDKIYRIVKK